MTFKVSRSIQMGSKTVLTFMIASEPTDDHPLLWSLRMIPGTTEIFSAENNFGTRALERDLLLLSDYVLKDIPELLTNSYENLYVYRVNL